MGKIQSIFLSMLVLLLISGCGEQSSGTNGAQDTGEDQYVLRLSNDATEQNAKVQAVQRWSELVEEESDGRLKIEVYHSAQLYNDQDAIQAVSIGNVDIALPPANLLSSIDPNWGIFEIPSLFGIDYDQYRDLVTGEVGQELAADLEEQLGAKVLGYYHMGNWMWASNTNMIESPEDFNGQKIRIIGGQLQESFMKEFGAAPTQIAWPEVYTALQQGVIDGVETTMSGANQINGWEVMDNVSYSKHKQSAYAMILNQDAWNELPNDLQDILQETFEESRVYQDELIAKVDAEGAQTFEDNGANVIELSKEQLKPFQERFLSLEEDLLDDLGIDPELVEKAKEAVN